MFSKSFTNVIEKFEYHDYKLSSKIHKFANSQLANMEALSCAVISRTSMGLKNLNVLSAILFCGIINAY